MVVVTDMASMRRFPLCLVAPLALVLVATTDRAHAAGWGDGSFVFDTPEQGAKLLGTEDEYTKRMTALDIAAHLKTDRTVSEQDYLQFAAAQTEAWSEHDKQAIGEMLSDFTSVLNTLPVPFTAEVALIRTTGAEEADAAYTRGDAIVLPDAMLSDRSGLRWLVAHELFHVVSRQNPALRDELYAAIGFAKADGDIAVPASVAAHILANPDTPDDTHFIRVQEGGQAVCAVPRFLYTIDRYDPQRGGPFFTYSELQFAVTREIPSAGAVPPDYSLVKPEQLSGLYEQIGRNTDYIIHPDEILAENFAMLLTGGSARSPEVLERMRAAFADPTKKLPLVSSCQ
jgi:hypothetical protein